MKEDNQRDQRDILTYVSLLRILTVIMMENLCRRGVSRWALHQDTYYLSFLLEYVYQISIIIGGKCVIRFLQLLLGDMYVRFLQLLGDVYIRLLRGCVYQISTILLRVG